MNPARRMKKRPNYGVKTVELSRGHYGYGFTISGQHPCILSCIVMDSPAHKAGLQQGDYLITVNGQNVSKVPHDDVVRLIGNSVGLLVLQIAENYYSDSSDEEVFTKPRYSHHRVRHGNMKSVSRGLLMSGQLSLDNEDLFSNSILPGPVHRNNCLTNSRSRQSPRHRKSNGYKDVYHLQNTRIKSGSVSENDQPDVLYRAVVGYLGTIEMPKGTKVPTSRVNALKNCIQRLRVEKKVHTMVVLSVFLDRITLINSHFNILADFHAERILFCGLYASDKKCFGLITLNELHSLTNGSSSCHVFIVDSKPHSEHVRRAKSFHLECTYAPETNQCQEFPLTAEPILNAIMSVTHTNCDAHFLSISGLIDNENYMSPRGSNTSSNSSNSDSGIGFRDDVHHNDHVIMLDVENERLCIQDFCSEPDDAVYNYFKSPHNPCDITSRLTVRAMPDPVGVTPKGDINKKINSSQSDLLNQQKPISLNDLSYRLSPKVYGVPFPTPLKKSSSRRRSFGLIRSLEELRESVRSSDAGLTNKMSCTSLDTEYYFDERFLQSSTLSSTYTDCYRSLQELRVSDVVEEPAAGKRNKKRTQPKKGRSRFRERSSHSVDLANKVSVVGKWRRSSLRRLSNRRRGGGKDDGCTVSDTELPSDALEEGISCGSVTSEPAIGGSRLGSWAISFEKLLEDQAGLGTFTEFLEKEFSEENIHFWAACEHYRRIDSTSCRFSAARVIFSKHLCNGAPEPVNVDAFARQSAEDGLEVAARDLFQSAQKQVFNLMKFDSYPRFLKSDLYKECVVRELEGRPILHFTQKTTDEERLPKKHDGEERWKPRLRPWSLKSKDGEYSKGEKSKDSCSISMHSDFSSSRTSLASATDLTSLQHHATSRESLSSSHLSDTEKNQLCRVCLPNKSTSVVQVRMGESVDEIVGRLMERRGLKYSAVELFTQASKQPLDPKTDSSTVGGKEIRVEERILFRLELPNRKSIGVKCRPDKTIREVLRPILSRYGFRSDAAKVYKVVGNVEEKMEMNCAVSTVDNHRLRVHVKGIGDWVSAECTAVAGGRKLNEITNRVFEDLMRGKQNVGNITKECEEALANQAKVCSHRISPDTEELYEGLKRGRLEDQRGTEINSELPEFLKPADKGPLSSSDSDVAFVARCLNHNFSMNQHSHSVDPWRMKRHSTSSESDSLPRLVVTRSAVVSSPLRKALDSSLDNTLVGEDLDVTLTSPPPLPHRPFRACLNPPPLPPKPKLYDSEECNSNKETHQISSKDCRSRKAVYLPNSNGNHGNCTMSFV